MAGARSSATPTKASLLNHSQGKILLESQSDSGPSAGSGFLKSPTEFRHVNLQELERLKIAMHFLCFENSFLQSFFVVVVVVVSFVIMDSGYLST